MWNNGARKEPFAACFCNDLVSQARKIGGVKRRLHVVGGFCLSCAGMIVS